MPITSLPNRSMAAKRKAAYRLSKNSARIGGQLYLDAIAEFGAAMNQPALKRNIARGDPLMLQPIRNRITRYFFDI